MPQFVRRRQVAQPGFNCRPLLAQTPRPQPVHQHPVPVATGGFFINSFHRNSLDLGRHRFCSMIVRPEKFVMLDTHNKIPTSVSRQRFSLCLCVSVVNVFLLTACYVERRKSDAELGLTPQQPPAAASTTTIAIVATNPIPPAANRAQPERRLPEASISRLSGMPANDARVTDIVRIGRDKMPGFGPGPHPATNHRPTRLPATLYKLLSS